MEGWVLNPESFNFKIYNKKTKANHHELTIFYRCDLTQQIALCYVKIIKGTRISVQSLQRANTDLKIFARLSDNIFFCSYWNKWKCNFYNVQWYLWWRHRFWILWIQQKHKNLKIKSIHDTVKVIIWQKIVSCWKHFVS